MWSARERDLPLLTDGDVLRVVRRQAEHVRGDDDVQRMQPAARLDEERGDRVRPGAVRLRMDLLGQ
jgi:hypothetical protein